MSARPPVPRSGELPYSAMFLPEDQARRIYDDASLADIAGGSVWAGFIPPDEAEAQRGQLSEVEALFTGWGCGPIDERVLSGMPRLRAIFYAGGTVKSWVCDEIWQRDIVVCSAYAANAIPVAEYTVGAILFSLKCGWHYLGRQQRERRYPSPVIPAWGGLDATIGLYSLGAIGRLVCERLRPFGFRLLACDPGVTEPEARTLGVQLVSLADLFARSQIVSLHAPLLPETTGIVTGGMVNALLPYGTLINTARGALIREDELATVLTRRPDLTAVLDVLRDEPPAEEHPLLALPNVFLTPHIAGAMGRECWRLGRLMVDEFQRWQRGDPLLWRIRPEQLPQLA